HIELNVDVAGTWSVYYACPCSFLDPASYGCRLHGTAEQPNICVHYNPYQCYYKPAFRSSGLDDHVIRVDRARLEHLTTLVTFDEDRNLCDQPDWETTVRELARIPLSDSLAQAGSEPEEEPTALWRELVALGRRTGASAAPPAFNLADPCEGCG